MGRKRWSISMLPQENLDKSWLLLKRSQTYDLRMSYCISDSLSLISYIGNSLEHYNPLNKVHGWGFIWTQVMIVLPYWDSTETVEMSALLVIFPIIDWSWLSLLVLEDQPIFLLGSSFAHFMLIIIFTMVKILIVLWNGIFIIWFHILDL